MPRAAQPADSRGPGQVGFGLEDEDEQFQRARWSALAERFGRSQNEVESIQSQFSKMNNQFLEALRDDPFTSFNQFLHRKNKGAWSDWPWSAPDPGSDPGGWGLRPSNYFTNFFEAQDPVRAGRASSRFAPTARRVF